jgi:hypothetical protein
MEEFITRVVGTIFYLSPVFNFLLSLVFLICSCVTDDSNVLISLMVMIIIFSVVHIINFVIARKMETVWTRTRGSFRITAETCENLRFAVTVDSHIGFWIYNIALCLLDFILLNIALSQLVSCSSYWKIDDPNVCLLIFINSLYSLIISCLFSLYEHERDNESRNKLLVFVINITFLTLILNLIQFFVIALVTTRNCPQNTFDRETNMPQVLSLLLIFGSIMIISCYAKIISLKYRPNYDTSDIISIIVIFVSYIMFLIGLVLICYDSYYLFVIVIPLIGGIFVSSVMLCCVTGCCDSCSYSGSGGYSSGYNNSYSIPAPSHLYDSSPSYQTTYNNVPCMPTPTSRAGNTSYAGGVYVGDHVGYAGTY